MKKIVYILGLVVMSSCENNAEYNNPSIPDSNYSPQPTYEEKIISVEEEELMNPDKFINARGSMRRNIYGEWVMEGTVSSNATVARYKDIVLEFTFLTKTGTVLGKESRIYYEFLNPKGSFSYKSKIPGYKQASNFKFEIISAKPASSN